MKVIGVTGGSGCGKTTVLRMMERLGCFAIDADEVYHRLLGSSEEMRGELMKAFPSAFTDGVPDRAMLGAIVYNDAVAMAQLRDITHVYILREIEHILDIGRRLGAPMAVVDAILLIESGVDKICDLVVGVIAPMEVRLNRIVSRDNVSRELALLRIQSQPDETFYRENCDYILENSKDDSSLLDKTVGFYDNLVNGKITPKHNRKDG